MPARCSRRPGISPRSSAVVLGRPAAVRPAGARRAARGVLVRREYAPLREPGGGVDGLVMRAVEIIEQVRATRGPSSSRAAPGSCRSARRAPRRWLGRPPSSRFPLSPTTAASTSSSTAAHLLGRQGIPGYPVDGAPADDRLRPHARHDDARVDVFEGAEPDICSPRVRDAPADKLVPMSLSSRTVDSAADRARVRHAGHSGDPGDRAMGSNAARRVQWMSCSTNGAGPRATTC